MDLQKLNFNTKILTQILKDNRPQAKYREINAKLPWKKVFIKPHAFEQFLARTFLNKDQTNVIEISKFIASNLPLVHFTQFDNEKDKRKTIDKIIILRISIGKLPFELVVADKEDNYTVITMYFDWTNGIIASEVAKEFERSKRIQARKAEENEFMQMLIDSFFSNKVEKDEFEKMTLEKQHEAIKNKVAKKIKEKQTSGFGFEDILKKHKDDNKVIHVEKVIEERPKRKVEEEIKVSANEFKADDNWVPDFIDVELDLDEEFNEED